MTTDKKPGEWKRAAYEAEVLWDSYSEYIGDSIDDLQEVAGSSIMNRKDFLNAMEDYATSQRRELVKEIRRELNERAVLQDGRGFAYIHIDDINAALDEIEKDLK